MGPPTLSGAGAVIWRPLRHSQGHGPPSDSTSPSGPVLCDSLGWLFCIPQWLEWRVPQTPPAAQSCNPSRARRQDTERGIRMPDPVGHSFKNTFYAVLCPCSLMENWRDKGITVYFSCFPSQHYSWFIFLSLKYEFSFKIWSSFTDFYSRR